MSKMENEPSRLKRTKKKKRSDRFLNISILIVVILIVITASFVLRDGNIEDESQENPTETKQDKDSEKAEVETENNNAEDSNLNTDQEQSKDELEDPAEEPGTLTHLPSDNSVVLETIVDTSWKPIATKQTGEHVSKYDGESVDWNEKKEAIAYATGSDTDALIFWKINNGGSPNKSVGIVSTHDKSEKYRVYIEWVDEEGWKPVQVDVLSELEE